MNATAPAYQHLGYLSTAISIVHDLRNPLATIHGSAELLEREGLSPAQIRRLARNVYSASRRIGELLEEFLNHSRGCDLDRKPTQVRALVESAVEIVATTADLQSVRITQDVPPDILANLDRPLLKRVLVNLLVNALEVMPDGGAIHISAAASAQSVFLRIRDTGPGIAPEIRDRLFRPFVTAGKPNGVGLGLAIARQAVIGHGGEIWTDFSARGACFYLRLPLNATSPAADSR